MLLKLITKEKPSFKDTLDGEISYMCLEDKLLIARDKPVSCIIDTGPSPQEVITRTS